MSCERPQGNTLWSWTFDDGSIGSSYSDNRTSLRQAQGGGAASRTGRSPR